VSGKCRGISRCRRVFTLVTTDLMMFTQSSPQIFSNMCNAFCRRLERFCYLSCKDNVTVHDSLYSSGCDLQLFCSMFPWPLITSLITTIVVLYKFAYWGLLFLNVLLFYIRSPISPVHRLILYNYMYYVLFSLSHFILSTFVAA